MQHRPATEPTNSAFSATPNRVMFREYSLKEANFSSLSFDPGLSQREQSLLTHPVTTLTAEVTHIFGDHKDGVIEFAAFPSDGGAIEVGYYYGERKPKSIIKVSTQIGCPFRCNFCNAGEEAFRRNLTALEIYEQAALMLKIASHEKTPWSPLPHKVNFAGTGEPLLNPALIDALELLAVHGLSMKVSTVFPGTRPARELFKRLAEFAGRYEESVQIQVSLISTDERFRTESAGGNVASFSEIVKAAELWRTHSPRRTQLNLSLILADQTPAEAARVWNVFPPELFRIRFRNYVSTEFGLKNDLQPISSSRMELVKEQFRERGYIVSDDATPTATEQAFSLASNVTRRNIMRSFSIPIIEKAQRRKEP